MFILIFCFINSFKGVIRRYQWLKIDDNVSFSQNYLKSSDKHWVYCWLFVNKYLLNYSVLGKNPPVNQPVYMYLHLLKSTYKIELIKLFLYVKHALQKRADAVYIES